MDRKLKLASLCLMLLTLVTVAVAATWIYSNTVVVTVSEYSLVLTVDNANPTKNQNITLTATLKLGTVPQSGELIHFYYNDTYEVGSKTTDSSGIAVLQWNATVAGIYNFKAGYEAP